MQIAGGAHDNTIGGSVAGAGNMISANGRYGVNITAASRNQVAGNLVGLTGDGLSDLGNRSNGIQIAAGSTENTIGGETAGESNVISGNGGNGIVINGTNTAWNRVFGNTIGASADGTAAVANALRGVVVSGGANHNDVGIAGTGNLISGNVLDGVQLKGTGTSANTVAGNTIGLDSTGLAVLNNGGNGVAISAGASDNTIGGTDSGSGNTIIGNSQSGILVMASQTVIQGNGIGAKPGGSSPFGNGSHGIFVTNGASNTLIGGTDLAAANTIDSNTGAGVLIGSVAAPGLTIPAGSGNAILGNSIFENASHGIDLGPKDGVTLNDSGDADSGPNGLQNDPTIATAMINGAQIEVDVELDSVPNTSFRIEFFASVWHDESDFGQGQTFLGFINVTTDESGHATGTGNFNYLISNGPNITATATNLATNDTSEFSQFVMAE